MRLEDVVKITDEGVIMGTEWATIITTDDNKRTQARRILGKIFECLDALTGIWSYKIGE